VENIPNSTGLFWRIIAGAPFGVLHVHVATADDYRKLMPVVLAAAFRGFPWVATIHSGHGADRLRAAAAPRRWLSTAMLARADTVICVNASVAAQLSLVAKLQSLVVIPPFSFGFSGVEMPPALQRFFADHDPVVTSVGFYEPLYGFDDAVRLMARVRPHYPRVGLLLIGDLAGAGWCEALIREHDLGEHVKLAGNLVHAECLAVMKRSALFLRATDYDGDSLSVREALSLGVPVVATATDFRPEGVITYQRGVFEDLVVKALAALASEGGHTERAPNDSRYLEQVRQIYLTKLS